MDTLILVPPVTQFLPWTVHAADGHMPDHVFDTREQAEAWMAAHLAGRDMQTGRERRRQAMLACARACDLSDDEQARTLLGRALTRMLRRSGWLSPVRLSYSPRPLIIVGDRRFDSYESFTRTALEEIPC